MGNALHTLMRGESAIPAGGKQGTPEAATAAAAAAAGDFDWPVEVSSALPVGGVSHTAHSIIWPEDHLEDFQFG